MLYDSNPTIDFLPLVGKKIDEDRQGEVLFQEFEADNDGSKKFYIVSKHLSK